MSRRELLEILVNYLESKRYLVVLDDVWSINLWREIRVSLQDKQLGSRVIITTRNENVASSSFGVESHVHHVQPLLKNEAWELFNKKAFSTNHNKTCPPELESLAWRIVEKCDGLPLAIVAIGGLMSSKQSRDEWQIVYDNINWLLQSDSLLDPVKAILLLSFNDLSSQLKHCFLYCSLFPEDYLIARKRIIRMWIAEGFVEHVNGVAPEDVADGYLTELCFRSMLQVEERNDQGRPRKVKMHDLIRELALTTCENEKFGLVYDGREVMGNVSVRRLSIHTIVGGNIVELRKGMSRIRSLLVFATDMSSLSILDDLLSQFNWLRTLDLEDVEIDKLPDTTVYLFNLRYLNLKGTLIQELPESIRHLRNLQYLNIKETMIKSIPQGITKLLNLRHLLMYSKSKAFQVFHLVTGTRAPSDIYKLQQLQSLSTIDSEGDVIKLVGNLSQIRKIGISNVKERDEIDLWVSIEKMTQLRSLFLFASNEEEILPVKELCPPLPHLRRLRMSGKLQRVIPWFSSLQSLTILWLDWSRLEDDLLPHIEALPNLTTLVLNNAYIGRELCFRKGFVKLLNLGLENFVALEKLTIGKGAIPNLRRLSLYNCMELSTLPLGLENLSNLQRLGLINVPKEIVQPIRKGGVDRSMVQHIPEILYRETSEWENLA